MIAGRPGRGVRRFGRYPMPPRIRAQWIESPRAGRPDDLARQMALPVDSIVRQPVENRLGEGGIRLLVIYSVCVYVRTRYEHRDG